MKITAREGQAVRARTLCGCGRLANHRGVCRTRFTKKSADGWALPRKSRAAKDRSPLLAECLLAFDALHDAAVRFAFAYRALRDARTTITERKMLAEDPDR